MTIYIGLVLLIISYTLIRKLLGKNIYLFLCFLAITLVLGLSSETIGLNDREYVYTRVFNLLKETTSFKECLDLASVRITSGWGFYIVTWLISRFTRDSHIYLLILTLPLNYNIIKYIKRYSANFALSLLVYITLIYPLTFTVVRQGLAMAVILVAYVFVKEKRYVASGCWILVAVSIHLSALVFVVVLIVQKFKIRAWHIAIPLVTLIVAWGSPILIFNMLNFFINDSTYRSRYLSSNVSMIPWTAIVIRYFILIFLYVIIKYSIINNDLEDSALPVRKRHFSFIGGVLNFGQKTGKAVPYSVNFYLWCALFATISVTLMSVLGEFQRIAAYFDIFAAFSIPQIIGALEKDNKVIISLAFCIFLIIYFLGFQLDNWNLLPYKFYF